MIEQRHFFEQSIFNYLLRNKAFLKAIHLLSRPVVLMALGILLVNDHLLRQIWASWWTGKIGDVVWLFFAPFFVMALVSLMLPFGILKRDSWSFAIGLVLVVLLFLGIKIDIGFNELATRIFSTFLHTPVRITSDITDLFTLPVLILAFYLYKKVPDQNVLSTRGLIALPLAGLLTLANAGIPDPGIYCLDYSNGTIIAQAGYTSYTSSDGGITWLSGSISISQTCESLTNINEGMLIEIAGSQNGILFRYEPGHLIQQSLDSGDTWQTIQIMEDLPQSQKQFYLRSHQGNAEYINGPIDGISDPITGNTIFAMGHQGVLLYTTDGDWIWRPVGQYRLLESFPNLSAFIILLGGTLLLSMGLFLLLFSSFALHWVGGPFRITLVSLVWIVWLTVNIIFPPALTIGYSQSISSIGIMVLLVVIIPLMVEQLVRLVKIMPGIIPGLIKFSLSGAILFILPYFLWLYSTLNTLLWATIFGLLLVITIILAGFISIRKNGHPTNNEKIL